MVTYSAVTIVILIDFDCFVGDSKLQFNNNVKETHSHPQVIQTAQLCYILTGFKSQPLFFPLPVVRMFTN